MRASPLELPRARISFVFVVFQIEKAREIYYHIAHIGRGRVLRPKNERKQHEKVNRDDETRACRRGYRLCSYRLLPYGQEQVLLR